MSTALEDPQPLVAQPEHTVLWMSRRSELRLVMQPRYPVMGAHPGQRIGETRGVTIPFRDGQIRVPKTGEARIMDPGGAGEARLPAEQLLEFLENHPRRDDLQDGFWRVDPTAPPVSAEETQRIVEAATGWDKETLAEIAQQERAGWERPAVIEAAEQALAKITELEAQATAQVEAARAETDELRRQLAEAQAAAKPKAQGK